MDTSTLSYSLAILGTFGTCIFIASAVMIVWHYRGARRWSFRRRWRDWRLTQLSAIASLFFLAMAASYGILGEVWGWIYLLIAFKTATWWLRSAINRGT